MERRLTSTCITGVNFSHIYSLFLFVFVSLLDRVVDVTELSRLMWSVLSNGDVDVSLSFIVKFIPRVLSLIYCFFFLRFDLYAVSFFRVLVIVCWAELKRPQPASLLASSLFSLSFYSFLVYL